MHTAKYTGKNGKRKEKHFLTLPEARNWLADMQYEDKQFAQSTNIVSYNWCRIGAEIILESKKPLQIKEF